MAAQHHLPGKKPNYSDAFVRKCSCSAAFPAKKSQVMLLKGHKNWSWSSSLPRFKTHDSDVLQHFMSSGLGEKGIPLSLRSEQGEKWQLQEAAPSVPHCTSLLDMDHVCCWNHPPSSLLPPRGHKWVSLLGFYGKLPQVSKSICSGALVFINAPTLAV